MDRKRLTVAGTVVELDWDEGGRVLALGLETDRDTYEIVESKKAEELADLVGCRARMTGWITDDSDADLRLLDVTGYTILEEAEDDEDDEENDDESDLDY